MRRVVSRPRLENAGPRSILPGRKIPQNRRNKFTNRFIPKVRPVGPLENIAENGFVVGGEDGGEVGGIAEEVGGIEDLVTSTTEALPSKVQQPAQEQEQEQEQQVEVPDNENGRPFR